MTIVARVLQNGLAPAYGSPDFVTIGGATVNYAGVRWEVDLGFNSHETLSFSRRLLMPEGPGVRFGHSTEVHLMGSGSTYHTYELEYNPSTLEANSSSMVFDCH